MILSADFFETVLKTLKTNGPTSDKRANARIGIRTQVRIKRCIGKIIEPEEIIWTRDISRSGIGLVYSKAIKVGQIFILELPREDEEPLRVVCQVCCKQRISDDLSVIGAAFQNPPANFNLPVAVAVAGPVDQNELIEHIKSSILD